MPSIRDDRFTTEQIDPDMLSELANRGGAYEI
ncbi:MAG: hypothetical protein K0Q94_5523 [Paenibacillus sp.]|jgi:hypothetical protein|nr:hypothetical protein [Paenibacillus sp.]